ncbi:LuxR C-terminal-related transcriptional regulator [Geodermatophilus sp. SYSU D00703]
MARRPAPGGGARPHGQRRRPPDRRGDVPGGPDERLARPGPGGAGDLDAAATTYARARRTVGPGGLPAAGIAAVGLARVAYQRDQLDAALGHLSDGIAACRQLVYSQPMAAGLALLAWTRQARGDPEGALAAMDEAAGVTPGPRRPSLLDPVPAQRARLLLVQGDVAGAAQWVTSSGLRADDEPAYPDEPGYLVLARVLLAQDLPEQALGVLDRLEPMAREQSRVAGLVEIRALRALALAARGAGPEALSVLADALRAGARAGLVRVLTDEGPSLRALVRRLVARSTAGDVPPDHLGRVLRAFETAPAPSGAAGPLETLSPREVEVLRWVAAGRRNQEIADALVVELSTVKKHVTHILQKLGVDNRTAAIARARALGLLPQGRQA